MADEPQTNDAPVESDPVSEAEPAVETFSESVGEESTPAELDSGIASRAKAYGLSEADIEGFDGGRVESMMASIDRGRMLPQQQQPQTFPSPAQPGTMNTPPAGQPKAMPTGYTPLKLEFGDELDESIVSHLKAIQDHSNAQIQNLHQMNVQSSQQMHAMNLMRELTDFDRFVGGLGDEWQKNYGTGATLDMDFQSPEFAKRMEIFQGGKGLQAHAAAGRQNMNAAKSWLVGHRANNYDRILEMDRNKTNGKVVARQKGFGERPTKGKAPAMSPREGAIEALRGMT